MPNISTGSKVWGYYSGKPDNGQAGEYRGVVKRIRTTDDAQEYLIVYEDGIEEWTARVRPRL